MTDMVFRIALLLALAVSLVPLLSFLYYGMDRIENLQSSVGSTNLG